MARWGRQGASIFRSFIVRERASQTLPRVLENHGTPLSLTGAQDGKCLNYCRGRFAVLSEFGATHPEVRYNQTSHLQGPADHTSSGT